MVIVENFNIEKNVKKCDNLLKIMSILILINILIIILGGISWEKEQLN